VAEGETLLSLHNPDLAGVQVSRMPANGDLVVATSEEARKASQGCHNASPNGEGERGATAQLLAVFPPTLDPPGRERMPAYAPPLPKVIEGWGVGQLPTSGVPMVVTTARMPDPLRSTSSDQR
jgi:hypothetical protein